MKYVLAIALVPLAVLELLVRLLVIIVLVVTLIGMLLIEDEGLERLLTPTTFSLIEKVIR